MLKRQQIGLTLRLLGPLIEILGLMLFLDDPENRKSYLGLPIRQIGLFGLVLGLVFVLAGLWLTRRSKRSRAANLELEI